MAYVVTKLAELMVYYNNECTDPRVRDLVFMKDPFAIFSLIGLYLMFVLKWGPDFMKNRKPYKLERIMQIYNLIQVIICLFLIIEAFRFQYLRGYNFLCAPIDFSWNPIPIRVARRVHMFFILKVIDLLDTVFFVLRKKQKQVTFLHVYHHAGMVALTWGAAKYLPGGHGVLTGSINCLVHVVMYGYYFLTSYDEKYKQNIWWKKHITQLQIIQFFIVFVHYSLLLIQPNCQYPKFTTIIVIPQNLFMFALFTDFYIRTYVRKPKAEKLDEISKSIFTDATSSDHHTVESSKAKIE